LIFLSPNSGLLGAAISLPLLLLIYFLKLRRKPLRISSTILWEQAVQDLQVNVPFRWLRVSLILILQLMALAALAAALGRPAIEGVATSADRVVIVIDHSASMSAREAGPAAGAGDAEAEATSRPTRLDRAKRRAIELVGQLQRTTTVAGTRPAAMIVASAASASVVQTATSIESDLVDAINTVQPTDQPGGIDAAMELLEAVRAASSESSTPGASSEQDVVAFTDADGGDWRGLGNRIVDVTDAGIARDNVGIVAMSVRRDVEQPETIRAFARIACAGEAAVTTTVRCLFDGAVVGARSVSIPGAGARGDKQGGEAVVSFELSRRQAGIVVLAVDRADQLDSDNAAGAFIGPATTPAVLVVAPAASQGADADNFLMGFLESLGPRELRVVDLSGYESEAADARSEGRPAWRAFNLVIFDRTEPSLASVPRQPSISFGAGLPIAGLALVPPDSSLPVRALRFDTWRRGDLLMRAVALEPILMSPAPATIGAQAATSGEPGASAVRVLAAGSSGPLIAALEEPNNPPRRVVVSFALSRSNWPPDTSFAVFMANAVDLLTGRGDAAVGKSFTTAAPVVVHPAAGAGVVSIDGPATDEIAVPRDLQDANARASPDPLNLGVLARAGVYRLSGAEEGAVCVNLLDQGETLLGGPLGVEQPRRAVSAGGRGAGALLDKSRREGRREIWHWFVMGALVAAVIEWFLFARQVRA